MCGPVCRRVCAWLLLKLTNLQLRMPKWETTMIETLIIRKTVCKPQIVRYNHVGGAFGQPNWNRSFVHRTSSCLRLVLAEICNFAISKTKMGNNIDQHLGDSLYGVRIACRKICSCWRCNWTGNLEPIMCESHLVVFSLNPCWD